MNMYRHSHLRQEIDRRSKGKVIRSIHGRRSTPEKRPYLAYSVTQDDDCVRAQRRAWSTYELAHVCCPFFDCIWWSAVDLLWLMRCIITFSLDTCLQIRVLDAKIDCSGTQDDDCVWAQHRAWSTYELAHVCCPFSIALGGPPLIYYDLYEEYNNFFSRCLLAD